jgi:hypothetical protein
MADNQGAGTSGLKRGREELPAEMLIKNYDFVKLKKEDKAKFLAKLDMTRKPEEFMKMKDVDLKETYFYIVRTNYPSHLSFVFPRFKEELVKEELVKEEARKEINDGLIDKFLSDAYENNVSEVLRMEINPNTDLSNEAYCTKLIWDLVAYLMEDIGVSVERAVATVLLQLRNRIFTSDENGMPLVWKESINECAKTIFSAFSTAMPDSELVQVLKKSYEDARSLNDTLRSDLVEAKNEIKELKAELREMKKTHNSFVTATAMESAKIEETANDPREDGTSASASKKN